MNYVAGYCLVLDMTAIDFIRLAKGSGIPWALGKCFDTATPVSKFITKAEISDPHNVDLWLDVNGKPRQRTNTKTMIFNVPYMISYTSQYMSMEPNDLLLTGSPKGAAKVENGDVITCGMCSGDNKWNMKFNVRGE